MTIHQPVVIEGHGIPRRGAGVAIGALTIVVAFGRVIAVTGLAIYQVDMVEGDIMPSLGGVAIGALPIIMCLGSVINVTREAIAAGAMIADTGPIARAMTIGALTLLVPSRSGVTGLAIHETVVIEVHSPVIGIVTGSTSSGIVVGGRRVASLAVGQSPMVK